MKNILQIVVAILLFSLSSCGWQPLYKKTSTRNSCHKFSVNTNGLDIAGQKFKYTLADRLNALCLDKQENYQIEVNLTEGSEGLGIQKDREITRYNVIINAEYDVTNSKSKRIVNGNFRRVGGYDAQTSHYGTYAIAEDAKMDIVEDLANELALHISTKISKLKE